MQNQNKSIFQIGVGLIIILIAFFLINKIALVFFTIGLLIGVFFPWLDAQYFYPRYKDKTIHSTEQLITKSFLFILAYCATAIFVVSSTNSAIGMGIILGLGLIIWSELLFGFQSPAQLNSSLGVKKPLKKSELQWLAGGFSFLYLVLLLMTFIR